MAILIAGANFTSAQTFSVEELKERFPTRDQSILQEEIFIHADKDCYVAGDIIWFKLYYVNRLDLQPLHFSKVAYVELLDQSGKPTEQAKLALDSNGSAGSFYLPLSLASGQYTLRAYTSWMKNFGSSSFFEKKLTIINTQKAVDELGVGNSEFQAQFFPEGGNMVNDITSRIGVRVTDGNGKGLSIQGMVIDSNLDTVARFSTPHFGNGSFELQPVLGQHYTAVIRLPNGKSIQQAMPDSYASGYVMRVSEAQPGKINISVQASFGAAGPAAREIYLAAHGKGSLLVAEKALIAGNSQVSFVIDKSKLLKGITHFTLFDRNGQPLCERLWFSGTPTVLPFQARMDRAEHKARERVDISLAGSISQDAGPANLSVSVYRLDSLSENDNSDILSYFALESELSGPVESPGFYFSNQVEAAAAMDNLLLTQGWRKFDWKELPDNRKAVIRFLPEYHGHVISARVSTKDGNPPPHKVDVFLSIPGAKTNLYVAETDSTGIARFDVKEYYRFGDIYVQVLNAMDSNYQVAIQSPFYDEGSRPRRESFHGEFLPVASISRRNISMQVQNIFGADSLQRTYPPAIRDTMPFFGRAEFVYRLDDYTRFTTMEEVLREYVVPVNVYMKDAKPHLKIFNAINREFYEDNVLVILDGVPLRDRNSIFNYDPAKVKRLEVIPQAYVLSATKVDGILNFSTYDAVFDGYDLDPHILSIDYEGLQAQRIFYSPSYATPERLRSKLPDFRQTLYWSPNLLTNKSGEANISFYTGDLPGQYRVVIQGMNERGELVNAQTYFTVTR